VKHVFVLLLAFSCVVPASYADRKVVRLGSTTSVKSSGFLAAIKPSFEKDTGYELRAYATGSGKAMKLARDGEFDVLIVHAPNAEKQLIAGNFAVNRKPFMKNYFLIVGPRTDPAKIESLSSVHDAFKQIAASKSLFISRADDSGTHKKEVSSWKAAKIDPVGSWYYESGLGMGASLALADKKSAYILVDNGTWLAKKNSLSLKVVIEDHQNLANTYSIVMLNKKKLKGIDEKAAAEFSKWLLSSKGKQIIRDLRVDGTPLFKLIAE
jgi:tungstate transport system substrate-binding protein